MTQSQQQPTDLLNMTVSEFVAKTAAKESTPGGGSVAGVVGALGVALGEMALHFTIGKKKYAEHAAVHERLAGRLARAREMFSRLVADDVAAFRNYQQAMKIEDESAKAEAMEVATAAAIAVPREAQKLALAVLDDLLALADKCNRWLISDLVAAAALCEAVVRLSDYNVRVNALGVSDGSAASDLRAGSAEDLRRAGELRGRIESAVREHLP